MREELVHPYHKSIAEDLIKRFEKSILASIKPNVTVEEINRVSRLRGILLKALTEGDTGKGP